MFDTAQYSNGSANSKINAMVKEKFRTVINAKIFDIIIILMVLSLIIYY